MSEISLSYDSVQNVILQQDNLNESGDWSEATYQEDSKYHFSIKKDQLKLLVPLSSVLPFLHFDSSTILPLFHSRIATSLLETMPEKVKTLDVFENDIVFRMPPISKVTVKVRINKVQKAIPHIFKPEEV